MPSDTQRRQFLSLLPQLSLLGGLIPYNPPDDDEIDIAIYVTEASVERWGMRKAYQLSTQIERSFNDALIDESITISVEKTVSVPEDRKQYAKDTAIWWKYSDIASDDTHSNLLLFSDFEVDWNRHAGYGFYEEPFAVANYYSLAGMFDTPQYISIHEIGHNFDLQHEDASVTNDETTVMYPTGTGDDRDKILTFSDTSKEKIRKEIERNS